MAIDLSILNDTITAFLDVGANIVSRVDVLVGLALIGIIILVATKLGKGLGELFTRMMPKGRY